MTPDVDRRTPPERGSSTAARLRAAGLVAMVLVLAVFVWTIGVPAPAELRATFGFTGPWLPVAAVAVAVLAAILLVPRAVPAILAGLLMPPAVAVLCALVGTVAGATVAFGLGRALGRPYLAGRTARASESGRVARLVARLERWLDGHGLKAVVYARFLPVFPFGLLSYVFGASRVRPGAFIVGTALGIAPSTTAYVLAGAASGEPGSAAFLLPAAATGVTTALGALHAYLARRRALPAPGRERHQ